MNTVGLYVDVENLQDIAKQAIMSTFESWPDGFPQPTMLRLYVRADQTELWQIWATNNFPSLDIQVKGVQHYVLKGSKNSADLSLALDALADIIKGRSTHIAILSDDSDFASLYTKTKYELQIKENKNIPFLWFVTDRPDTRSPTLSDFFPTEHLRMINCTSAKATQSKQEGKSPIEALASSEDEKIALTIIQEMPLGVFKSTECKRIIDFYFPKHSLANLDNPAFGTQFLKTLWPFLEKYGVLLRSPGQKPRKYEMTTKAKESIGIT
ncbi:NYN domain-containing protein [Candidatus Pacearchaeota archaeon]|nr:NYN domain-containing protein [Candidatus Pacearchaeota archaeon]